MRTSTLARILAFTMALGICLLAIQTGWVKTDIGRAVLWLGGTAIFGGFYLLIDTVWEEDEAYEPAEPADPRERAWREYALKKGMAFGSADYAAQVFLEGMDSGKWPPKLVDVG